LTVHASDAVCHCYNLTDLCIGVIETDFPDIWSKVVIQSEYAGTMLCIPRERNMTRLYIELDRDQLDHQTAEATQGEVMRKAKEILNPCSIKWESVGEFVFGKAKNE